MSATLTATRKQCFPRTPTSIPCSMELAMYFEKFVKYSREKAETEYLGYTSDDTLDMPVEVCVRWTGSVGGTLVTRCYREFLDWLMQSRD